MPLTRNSSPKQRFIGRYIFLAILFLYVEQTSPVKQIHKLPHMFSYVTVKLMEEYISSLNISMHNCHKGSHAVDWAAIILIHGLA